MCGCHLAGLYHYTNTNQVFSIRDTWWCLKPASHSKICPQPLCLPNGTSCYRQVSNKPTCTIPCHGLYSGPTNLKVLTSWCQMWRRSTPTQVIPSARPPWAWRRWWRSTLHTSQEIQETQSPTWKVQKVSIFAKTFYRVGARKQIACGDDLHQQPHVWPDHEGRQDHVHGQAGHHRGHPGTLHRIFGDQWDRGENKVSKEANSQHQNQTSKLVKPVISPDPLLLGQTRDRSAWKPDENQGDEGK